MEQKEVKSKIWKTNREQFLTQPRPQNPYFQNAYDFIQLWLSGKQEFNLQTSGSTGVPKTISVSRNQLSSSAAMTGQALDLGVGTSALVCLNTAYVAGLMMLVRGIELGWQLAVVEPASNPLLLTDTDSHFDFVAMVPLQLSTCLENQVTKNRVNDLGKILLGGAPVSVSLLREVLNLTIPVYQSYGMTETVSHVALRKLNQPEADPYYTILPGVDMGSDSRDCLYVSGPMTRYEVIQTNDLVEIVSSTQFRWLGRIDNVINSGGVKLILDRLDEQIAEILFDLGLSNPFFTWHEHDEKLGQKLILIIEENVQELAGETILTQIRNKLSAYETPKHVYFAVQFLKTATDKIDKRRTAEMLFNKSNG